jgi:DEAD/DEAH box helicase domain-containing protein
MPLIDLLQTWRAAPGIADNVVTWRTFPARSARIAPFPPDLHPALAERLRAEGIESLYTHQAAAWEHVRAGRQPVIVTGTASGKTLAYNLPILDRLLRRPEARALYLFPTKALARDQAETVRRLLVSGTSPSAPPPSPFTIAAYDGDTPASRRPAIRQQARLLITNPDMLHAGILPHHTSWADFFHRLQFVVLDEMHVYRGVFGSHVANVLRRLRRVAHFYGARPQFILTSATIANPEELAERLIEGPVALVDEDGASRGTKHFLIYNPPVVDIELGLRRSVLSESVRLAGQLLEHEVQTIIFGRTRRTVELLLSYLREHVTVAASPESSPAGAPLSTPLPSRGEVEGGIRGYRSGYLPRQRREIEQGLRSGRVRAVAATSALELGIDIGGMGAAVLAGYPGTIAGTWQQAGRAGRQETESLAVLVTSANPLDQFLAHHPAYFFARSPEQALINPDNLLILWQHLRCAAFELPFHSGEGFGPVEPGPVEEMLRLLQQAGDLHQTGGKYFWMADQYPAERVSLRSASPDKVSLLAGEEDEQWTTIGEVDLASAAWMVHPQAVYLHEGQTYLVESLDLEQLAAHLRPARVDYYTEPHRETTIALLETLGQAGVPGATKAFGEMQVTSQVTAFQRIRWFTHEHLGGGEVSLPPTELQTTGYWLALAPGTVDRLRDQGLWTNDPNDYGPNWPVVRDQVRARDGYRCQMCGAPERGRAHDVHHKVPFRTFASYREANRLSNLITLCRACHGRAETAVRMRSGLAGLAFALGHLAPLFLMCDANDVAVHADPKPGWADYRPAVVIYDLAPGGIGFSERLFALHQELMNRAYELVSGCGCGDGCPSCVGPAGEDGAGGKRQTVAILEELVGS